MTKTNLVAAQQAVAQAQHDQQPLQELTENEILQVVGGGTRDTIYDGGTQRGPGGGQRR